MFKKLKEDTYRANILIAQYNLVIFNWGNASQKSEDGNYIAIKPSGVDYNKLTPEDIVVVDMDGKTIEGNLKPSVDTKTHLELYKSFPDIKGVCHTHSNYATAFAQAGRRSGSTRRSLPAPCRCPPPPVRGCRRCWRKSAF